MYERTGAIDFDGDGKDDWYCIGSQYGNLNVFPSTGSSFLYPAFGSLDNNFCDEPHYVLGDFNGDGRTDAACTSTGHVALSTGNHFVVQPESPPFGAWCYASGAVAFAADVDGDGASEIVCNYHGAPANDIEVRKWKGEAWAPVEIWKASWCAATVLGGDFNGDGKTDLLCSALSSPVVAGTGGLQSDLLAVAGNGLGGTVQTSYTTSANFPNTNNPPPKQVAVMVTTNDGRGGSSTKSYSYAGGLMDRQERRFLGFHYVKETLPCVAPESSCPYLETWLRQDLPSAGKPERVERRDGTGRLLRAAEYEYTTNTPQIPRTSFLTNERSYSFDATGNGCTSWPCPYGKRTRTTHQYDGFGNKTQSAAYGDEDGPEDETTFVWTFRPNATTSAYIVNRIAMQQQFKGVPAGAKLSERHFWYDGANTWDLPPSQGFVTASFDWLNWPQPRYVGRFMDYDTWGNLISETDPTSRMTVRTYDSAHHVFPENVTIVGLPETENTMWDPVCALPYQRTDANNQVSTLYSDNFCRPSLTTFPLGDYESREYLSIGDPNWQRVKVMRPSASPEDGTGDHYVAQHFDGLGRAFRVVSKGPTPSMPIVQDRTYNARGEVASETAPYYLGQPIHTTTYTYDGFDRLTAVHFPDNNQITKTYDLWKETTFDEHNHPVTTRLDAYGRQVRTEQVLLGQVLVTQTSYDPLGRLVGIIDPVGSTWSWSFDSLGRTYSRSDPDSGTWTFEYDDAGRLLSQTDAKSQETGFTYDPAGRLSAKTNAAGPVNITRSEPRSGFFNIGRITTVSDPHGTVTMDYDARGRGVRHARTLEGAPYVAERRYDAGGRLRGITYPDGEAVGTPASPLLYDAAGRLRSIPGFSSFIQYDAAGRLTSQINAATVTTRTYTSRGFLTSIATTSSGNGGTVQNLLYTADAAGVLLSQVSSPFPGESWTYNYDDLHRLTVANSSSDAQTFQYDSIGRITYNDRIGIYAYPPPQWPHPHAPTSIGASSYSYDLNGNVSFVTASGGNRLFQWNSDNLLTQITVGGATTTFTYDGLGQRLKKSTTGGSMSLYPVGDDYEVTNGVVTKYISVGAVGVIAKRVSGNTYWLHTDHLGSIQAITDSSGLVVQRRTYRPYGDKIADIPSPPPLSESRGYIDQRQDGETGLTYLHARYYDPSVGIFISPDPLYPAEPGVGLNRYGYAFGNPVNANDRSGLKPRCASRIVEIETSSWTDSSSTVEIRNATVLDCFNMGNSAFTEQRLLESIDRERRAERGLRDDLLDDPVAAVPGIIVAPPCAPNCEPPDVGGMADTFFDIVASAIGVKDAFTLIGPSSQSEKVKAALGLALLALGGVFGREAGAGAAFIDDALKAVKQGTSPWIKTVGSADDLERLFGLIGKGARPLEKPSYPRRYFELPDGTTVGLRESKRFGPTMDVRLPDGTLWKVHVE